MSNQVFASPDTVYTSFDASIGSGDVTGPASSTDLSLALFSGVTGKLIQNSNTELKDNKLSINSNQLEFACENSVSVFSAADFPAPVAGVISLAANTTYNIKKSFIFVFFI